MFRLPAITLFICFCFIFIANVLLKPPQPGVDDMKVVEIPPAATATDVARLLKEEGLIRSTHVFRLLGKLTGQETAIQAGQYNLGPAQTPREILQILAEGLTFHREIKVVIPEGYTVRQMARLLEAEGITKEADFLAIAKNGDLDSKYFADMAEAETDWRWEGFFFPDTYLFLPNSPAEEVAQKMLHRLDEVWSEEIKGLTDFPADLKPRELITLASLVEREAKLAEERPLIAAVFYNRLRKDMLLQSCATVQYLFPEQKPELSEEDTTIPSPYNTYLHGGLPPGPIAAPGREAIRAVLRPGNSENLYFLAKPDGSHAFSTTYQGHVNNQRIYQSK